MQFNVPQFIDIEDKIVGPLTAKQLGWLAAGGAILLIMFTQLDTSAFVLSVFIVGGSTGALAFYRPYNQPLIKFIFSSITYVFRPKMYIWRRISRGIENLKHGRDKKKEKAAIHKTVSNAKIEEIGKLLDRQNH